MQRNRNSRSDSRVYLRDNISTLWPALIRPAAPVYAYAYHDVNRCDTVWYTHNRAENFTVVMIVEGTMCYQWEEHMANLQAGDLFVTVPGARISFGNTDRRPYRKLFCAFHFNHDAREMAGSLFGFTAPGPVRTKDPTTFSRRMMQIGALLGKAPGLADSPEHLEKLEFLIAEKSWALLLRLMREHSTGNMSVPFPLTLAQTFILQHFQEKITMEEIARSAGVSLSTLRRLFFVHCGTSPLKFLTERRLRHAEFLLAERRCFLKEIAARSGFSSPLHFYRAYHAKYGIAPSESSAVRRSSP